MQHFLPDEDGDDANVPMLLLVTASQAELQEEAELMNMMKSVRLRSDITRDFNLPNKYSKIYAPFNAARTAMFFDEPHCEDENSEEFKKAKRAGLTNEPGDLVKSGCKCGLTYFSEAERQLLIEHIIDNTLSNIFKTSKVDISFFPLHDKDGEGGNDLLYLRQHWANIFNWRRVLGCFNIFSNPNRGVEQPLDDIRNYFGDHIGFYFAFLGFYTKWLSYPALCGLFFFIYQKVEGEDNAILPLYAICLSLWSFTCIRFWQRQQCVLAYRWGVSDIKEEVRVRREFVNDLREEATCFKGWDVKKMRTLKYAIGSNGLLLMLIMAVASFLAFFVYWGATGTFFCDKETGPAWGAQVGSILHALAIMILNVLYRKVAVMLNNWENHKTQDVYDNRFIQKVFCFEFMNNFLSLFFLAFFRDLLQPDNLDPADLKCSIWSLPKGKNTMEELGSKLASIFVTKFVVSNFFEVAVPWLKKQKSNWARQRAAGGGGLRRGSVQVDLHKATAADLALASRRHPDALPAFDSNGVMNKWVQQATKEFQKPAYDSTLDDFNELVIQFSFVVLFGIAFPLTGLLAMVSNILEISIDSYKLCRQHRRPMAERAASIPLTWLKILQMLCFLGIFTNTIIIVQSADTAFEYLQHRKVVPSDVSGSVLTLYKWLVAFVFEHIIFTLRIIVESQLALPPVTVEKKEIQNRAILRRVMMRRNNDQPDMSSQPALTPRSVASP